MPKPYISPTQNLKEGEAEPADWDFRRQGFGDFGAGADFWVATSLWSGNTFLQHFVQFFFYAQKQIFKKNGLATVCKLQQHLQKSNSKYLTKCSGPMFHCFLKKNLLQWQKLRPRLGQHTRTQVLKLSAPSAKRIFDGWHMCRPTRLLQLFMWKSTILFIYAFSAFTIESLKIFYFFLSFFITEDFHSNPLWV